MKNILGRFGIDGFILSLFGAILLAGLYPDFGARKGLFSLSSLANFGVSVIFFFYGLRLNWAKIREGVSNVKMHVVVVLSTFLLFPLLVLGAMKVANAIPTRAEIAALRESSERTVQVEQNAAEALKVNDATEVNDALKKTTTTGIWLGVFFLAALPSTVSSSVVMTNIARGNVPAAIFDASASSLLGVFITPLWMRVFIDSTTGGRGLGPVLLSLTAQVLLPVVLGVYANRYWGTFSQKHDKGLRKCDQATIVLIVYVSFCNSFKEKMFKGLDLPTLIYLHLGAIALFFTAYAIVGIVCRALKFNREDTIATLFCGSKKSLVHGAAMSRVILSSPQMAGILILPTMIYHALQLIIVSVLAKRFARQISNEK